MTQPDDRSTGRCVAAPSFAPSTISSKGRCATRGSLSQGERRGLRRLRFFVATALVACSRAQPPYGTSAAASGPPSATASSSAVPVARDVDRLATARGDLVIVPLHHASILFRWQEKAFYVDPTRTAVADPTLPKADAIFITHLHRDHVDGEGLGRVSVPRTVVVAPLVVADRTNVDVVIGDGDVRPVLGVPVRGVPMYNLARGPVDGGLLHERGKGEGFVFDFGGTLVYVSGDTACTPEVRALRRIDVAFIAVSTPSAMSVQEAADCIRSFQPKIVYPDHFSGSQRTVEELTRLLSGSGVEVRDRRWY